MCQFAGYEQADGSVVGDPAAVGITKVSELQRNTSKCICGFLLVTYSYQIVIVF